MSSKNRTPSQAEQLHAANLAYDVAASKKADRQKLIEHAFVVRREDVIREFKAIAEVYGGNTAASINAAIAKIRGE